MYKESSSILGINWSCPGYWEGSGLVAREEKIANLLMLASGAVCVGG